MRNLNIRPTELRAQRFTSDTNANAQFQDLEIPKQRRALKITQIGSLRPRKNDQQCGTTDILHLESE